MRFKMVRALLEKIGIGGPTCRELRQTRDDLAKTVVIKHESIIAKREERRRERTGEVPEPSHVTGGY